MTSSSTPGADFSPELQTQISRRRVEMSTQRSHGHLNFNISKMQFPPKSIPSSPPILMNANASYSDPLSSFRSYLFPLLLHHCLFLRSD